MLVDGRRDKIDTYQSREIESTGHTDAQTHQIKCDLVKRRITSVPGLADIVVVYFHTKTPLVLQKGESGTSARS